MKLSLKVSKKRRTVRAISIMLYSEKRGVGKYDQQSAWPYKIQCDSFVWTNHLVKRFGEPAALLPFAVFSKRLYFNRVLARGRLPAWFLCNVVMRYMCTVAAWCREALWHQITRFKRVMTIFWWHWLSSHLSLSNLYVLVHRKVLVSEIDLGGGGKGHNRNLSARCMILSKQVVTTRQWVFSRVKI